MDKESIIVIGSKPVDVDLTPIIDQFDNNIRVNFGLPGNKNGTKRSRHILNSHMHRNWHTMPKEDFRKEYYKKAHKKYVDDFIDTFNADDYEKVYGQCMNIIAYNEMLEKLDCPLRFSKLPRCGMNAVFLAIEEGFHTIVLTGFSLIQDSKSYYATCETSNCHDVNEELEILRWMHVKGVVDATMCLLEYEDMLTIPLMGQPIRLALLMKLNKPIMIKGGGFFIIYNFYTPEEVFQMECEFTRVFNEHPDSIEILDKEGCSNDERIFHAQEHSSVLNNLVTKNQFLRNFVEKYTKRPIKTNKLLLNRLTYEEGKVKNSGAGWHRDNHSCQFKTLIYLTDVTEKNGNFQFMTNSSPAHIGMPKPRAPSYNTRFADETIQEILETLDPCNIINIVGKKGTVILSDTTYIHRGNIIEEGERRAITQYYF